MLRSNNCPLERIKQRLQRHVLRFCKTCQCSLYNGMSKVSDVPNPMRLSERILLPCLRINWINSTSHIQHFSFALQFRWHLLSDHGSLPTLAELLDTWRPCHRSLRCILLLRFHPIRACFGTETADGPGEVCKAGSPLKVKLVINWLNKILLISTGCIGYFGVFCRRMCQRSHCSTANVARCNSFFWN